MFDRSKSCRSALPGLLAALLCGAVARADTLHLRGTDIPLRDCRIEAFRGGEIIYRDRGGRRWSRELGEIRALGFDGVEHLDEAERVIGEGQVGRGLYLLAAAAFDATTDVQRIWIHARLSWLHDLRREYVPAVGHAVRVWLLSDDAYWSVLTPTCRLDDHTRPTYPAAVETMNALRQADRDVQQARLVALVGRFIEEIDPVCDALADDYHGPPITPGSTISGLTRDEVNAALQGRRAAEPARGSEADTPEAVSTRTINDLLDARNFDEALRVCRQVAASPGPRDLGRFLVQYGAALQGTGAHRDAAVMFMRCAILYPDSGHTPNALLAAAEIHRVHFSDVNAARRLLEEAITRAEELDRPKVLDQARRALAAMPPG